MFTNILVGVDGRDGGRDAIALAKRLSPGARLTLAHVYSTGRAVARGGVLALPFEPQDSERLLEAEKAAAGVDADLVSSSQIPPARGLRELAKRAGADLLVVGASRHSALGHILMGDDARAVLGVAPCAVAIAPRGYALTFKRLDRLGVGYDGSAESEYALELAGRIADRNESAIRTAGCVAEDLASLSKDVDLLVLGSRGRGRIGRLLHDRVSNRLARQSACAVLVVSPVALADHGAREANPVAAGT